MSVLQKIMTIYGGSSKKEDSYTVDNWTALTSIAVGAAERERCATAGGQVAADSTKRMEAELSAHFTADQHRLVERSSATATLAAQQPSDSTSTTAATATTTIATEMSKSKKKRERAKLKKQQQQQQQQQQQTAGASSGKGSPIPRTLTYQQCLKEYSLPAVERVMTAMDIVFVPDPTGELEELASSDSDVSSDGSPLFPQLSNVMEAAQYVSATDVSSSITTASNSNSNSNNKDGDDDVNKSANIVNECMSDGAAIMNKLGGDLNGIVENKIAVIQQQQAGEQIDAVKADMQAKNDALQDKVNGLESRLSEQQTAFNSEINDMKCAFEKMVMDALEKNNRKWEDKMKQQTSEMESAINRFREKMETMRTDSETKINEQLDEINSNVTALKSFNNKFTNNANAKDKRISLIESGLDKVAKNNKKLVDLVDDIKNELRELDAAERLNVLEADLGNTDARVHNAYKNLSDHWNAVDICISKIRNLEHHQNQTAHHNASSDGVSTHPFISRSISPPPASTAVRTTADPSAFSIPMNAGPWGPTSESVPSSPSTQRSDEYSGHDLQSIGGSRLDELLAKLFKSPRPGPPQP